MNVEQRQVAVDPQTKPTDLDCYCLHPPLSFIITQPESWYSFYRPRRVEGWVNLGTHDVRNLPKVLTGSDQAVPGSRTPHIWKALLVNMQKTVHHLHAFNSPCRWYAETSRFGSNDLRLSSSSTSITYTINVYFSLFTFCITWEDTPYVVSNRNSGVSRRSTEVQARETTSVEGLEQLAGYLIGF